MLSCEFLQLCSIAAHEDRVRRDPGSTDEDVSAAIAARKAAEMNALLHEADLQPRLAEQKGQPTPAAERPEQDAWNERTDLDVPFKEKDAAKALGARWDRKAQSWYVPPGVDVAPFARWAQGAAQGSVPTPAAGAGPTATEARVYLAVPYGERGAAKAAGERSATAT